ncbi:MAG TPA: bifunctional UDP-3-O-[3-hydroxymyristoyl] N-acetylglucosamine deacetylase/3-hydroxyacyl-ACP dehydratase [Opitutaceae bacterium]|jgi:UDP-3-O-[3-hydroxymyristoyl] N-acetylglucosamine deacetylase/3-hydroxyacyl-[acyl-carrier-protein] dehydratase
MKQRTVAREASIKGTALHTGEAVTLTLKPAPANHGIAFRRIDLRGSPEIKPRVDLVTDLVRATTIQSGHAKIHTVEHILSALHGLGVDNAIVEMDASEPPIVDGSARPYVNLILEAEPVEQDAEREYFELDAPVSVSRGNSSVIALPCDHLKISCTSADDRGIHTQHLSLSVDPDVYRSEIAAARTFTIYEDIEELLKLGKIRGGSLDSAVVIKGDSIISKEPLRFKDEFVRHKILDIIGDIMLLGVPLHAHIVATRPGHAINAELTKLLFERREQQKKAGKKPPAAGKAGKVVVESETSMDIRRVLDVLPHRYPFVMIDRVESFNGDEITAIKNVTINEPYFGGHFPGNPVMPGVLQLEAMAQAAGLVMMRTAGRAGDHAFFMSADKVKFRRPVRPGDQLVITAKLLKSRGKLATATAQCRVGDKVVSSAELMFTTIENPDGEG